MPLDFKFLPTFIGDTLRSDRVRHILRVGLVGASGFVIQTSIFETIGIQLEILKPSTAALIGGEIAILSNFILNNRFNFTNKTENSIWTRLAKFHAVVSFSLIIQWTCVRIAESSTDNDMHLRLAYAAGVLIGFVVNYLGYTLFVWRTPKDTQNPAQ